MVVSRLSMSIYRKPLRPGLGAVVQRATIFLEDVAAGCVESHTRRELIPTRKACFANPQGLNVVPYTVEDGDWRFVDAVA